TSAGGWCLFASHAGAWEQRHLKFSVGESGIRAARLLLIAALPMIGLSHFVYRDLTASLVPQWLLFPLGWTYLTGAASLAAAAGMLFGIFRVSRRISKLRCFGSSRCSSGCRGSPRCPAIRRIGPSSPFPARSPAVPGWWLIRIGAFLGWPAVDPRARYPPT